MGANTTEEIVNYIATNEINNFTWRFCHDEYWDSNFKEIKNHHYIDRFSVSKIKCLEWDNIQEPKEQWEKCKIKFAKYWCLKCNFFDDKGIVKKAFHCDEWKIWRVGGRENFFHCGPWNACLGMILKDSHECADFTQNCPICFEGFHNSRDGAQILNCKHIIHSKCYRKMLKTSYVCPICKKTTLDENQTQHVNVIIQNHIDNTQMGELGERDVKIICNDWGEKTTVKYHIVAHKCPKWESFNTSLN